MTYIDEPVGPPTVESARVLKGMVESVVPVREPVFDGAAEGPGDSADLLAPEVAPDDVAPERQREAGLLLPPAAEVDDLVEPVVAERQLSLVDQEPGRGVARRHLLLDPVEWDRDGPGAGRPERQRERRSRPGTRGSDDDSPRRDVLAADRIPSHHDRTVPVAERGAVRQEHVAVGDVGVGVEGDGGDVELACHRAPVQRLDVGELVVEREALGVDRAVRETVEHESVVGVRTVREGDLSHRRILVAGRSSVLRSRFSPSGASGELTAENSSAA